MKVVVAIKWADLRPEVDTRTGTVTTDERWSGASAADQAALEWGLRAGERWSVPVEVMCVGPAEADRMLREALACGATSATRVDADGLDSATVAGELAAVIGDAAALVVCGDYSVDRGSGSVPAFLAHELGAQQALGLVDVELGAPGRAVVLRRLDGGRRERLAVGTPAVISVEGATARLRRAGLKAELAAAQATISVRPARHPGAPTHPAPTQPYRPRARVLPPPAGDTALDRVRVLTGAGVTRTPPATSTLEPADAARAIVEQLRAWGYLGEPG